MEASRRGSGSRPPPGGGGSSNFKVAVRVRPKIERENKEGAIDVCKCPVDLLYVFLALFLIAFLFVSVCQC